MYGSAANQVSQILLPLVPSVREEKQFSIYFYKFIAESLLIKKKKINKEKQSLLMHISLVYRGNI